MSTTAHVDGPCPFVTCAVTVAHDHPVCPDCDAVGFGNIFCKTCRSTWGDTWPPEREAAYGAALDANFRPARTAAEIAPYVKAMEESP